jgi:hypothetical protein
MAIRVLYSEDPVIAELQRKRDQQHELMCMALNDSDKEMAKRYADKAEEYQRQIRELL